MSNVTQQTAWNLKRAGMPQPEPAPGMMFYFCDRLCMLSSIRHEGTEMELRVVGCSDEHYQCKEQLSIVGVFAPSLDYIAPYLPEGFILQMWGGRHSCKIETEDTTIRTQADSFAEAAALAYLSLQNEAPASDFSPEGATSET